MKQKQIFLFGGGSDGKKVKVNEGAKSVNIDGEKYHIVHEYNLAFTEELASKRSGAFNYVFNELLETYSQIRTGGEMQTAKSALKKRVSKMKTFVPIFGFSLITSVYFFLFKEINQYFSAVLIPGVVYFIAFRAGFVEIKNRVKRL